MDAAEDDAALLMSRLASQFGDMDLTHLLESGADCAANGNQNNETEEESEESSLVEPTPEELQAWQEQQFKIGEQKRQTKELSNLTPLQKRLRERRQQQQQQQQQQQGQRGEEQVPDSVNNESSWEHIPARPDLGGEDSFFFPSSCDDSRVELLGGVHPLLQQLAQEGDPEILGTQWRRLFSSNDGDGLSFGNLLEKLKGYDGPTIMFISALPSAKHSLSTTTTTPAAKRSTLGFFTTTPWKESTEFFGSEDCFLFAFDEEQHSVRFFRPVLKEGQQQQQQRNSNYMYCYPSSFKDGKTKANSSAANVHGIGIGGKPSQPRVHVTESLEECRALTYCHLFEPGDLLLGGSNRGGGGTDNATTTATGETGSGGGGLDSLYYFDVECIEVWGVGGEEWINQGLAMRQKAWEIRQANLRQRQTVDKKQFLDDFRSGIYNVASTSTAAGNNGGTLFEHMDHVAGRVDLCD